MPRLPRLDLPGVAQHVVQRGNDRQPCFFRDEDHQRYLTALRELCTRFGCHVHAYVLMTNHVHLLVTPERAGVVSRLMQSLGRRYVRYANDRYHRTGTLWEGRFRSCLVDTEQYVLACYRYIELNPIRAGMTDSPLEYRWSSFAGNATAASIRCRPHSCYLALGATPAARTAAYALLVAAGLDDPHGRNPTLHAAPARARKPTLPRRHRSPGRPTRRPRQDRPPPQAHPRRKCTLTPVSSAPLPQLGEEPEIILSQSTIETWKRHR